MRGYPQGSWPYNQPIYQIILPSIYNVPQLFLTILLNIGGRYLNTLLLIK